MEYLIGSLATAATAFLTVLFMNRKKKTVKISITQTQSSLFEITKTTEQTLELLSPKLKTQATIHQNSNLLRIIFVDNQAYWIKESVFYTADLDDFGFIDAESTRAVDTMAMDKVQLDKMSFIVEKLTEGK